MKVPTPNWKRVACPSCGAQAGGTCTFRAGVFYLAHHERRRLAERTFGVYMPITLGSKREKTPQMRYWSNACRSGHPEDCSGVRKARNGERGVKRCENPIHTVTTAEVTKVSIEFPASME